ncbi:MAG: tetratricopeptide repeat protein [Sulfurospirillaceae bacterium]|nr:tetratricopeptide repeat protein [Sulfurospirillaceae bacterium]
MENFFIEYRDPMFGIIVLFAIVFIISFANYWWGVFKSKEEKDSIEKFVKRFEIVTDENEYKKLLEDFNIPLESLALLAGAYAKSGDYEKAINIYIVALKRVKGKSEKQYLLSTLGKTYFKAGFLRRASDVFLESLRLHPRNEESLKYLMVVYETLKEYDKAEEVLDSLEELGVKVTLQKSYLGVLSVMQDRTLKDKEKIAKLLKMVENIPFLKRKVFEFMQATRYEMSKEFFNSLDYEAIVDLLWFMDNEWFDISTCKDNLVQEIAMAKELTPYILHPQAKFEFDVIARFKSQGWDDLTLNFEYMCSECKQVFPIHFYRCPACQAINSVKIQPLLAQKNNEENIPFL